MGFRGTFAEKKSPCRNTPHGSPNWVYPPISDKSYISPIRNHCFRQGVIVAQSLPQTLSLPPNGQSASTQGYRYMYAGLDAHDTTNKTLYDRYLFALPSELSGHLACLLTLCCSPSWTSGIHLLPEYRHVSTQGYRYMYPSGSGLSDTKKQML